MRKKERGNTEETKRERVKGKMHLKIMLQSDSTSKSKSVVGLRFVEEG